MAQYPGRWNVPQMYRRFETMEAMKFKESESGMTREGEWWWRKKRGGKEREKGFLEPRFIYLTTLRIWEVD